MRCSVYSRDMRDYAGASRCPVQREFPGGISPRIHDLVGEAVSFPGEGNAFPYRRVTRKAAPSTAPSPNTFPPDRDHPTQSVDTHRDCISTKGFHLSTICR